MDLKFIVDGLEPCSSAPKPPTEAAPKLLMRPLEPPIPRIFSSCPRQSLQNAIVMLPPLAPPLAAPPLKASPLTASNIESLNPPSSNGTAKETHSCLNSQRTQPNQQLQCRAESFIIKSDHVPIHYRPMAARITPMRGPSLAAKSHCSVAAPNRVPAPPQTQHHHFHAGCKAHHCRTKVTPQALSEHILILGTAGTKQNNLRMKTRQFACQDCGRCFFRKSDLVRHIQIHLGIKPNVCHVCGKQFVQRSALTVHLRVHTGEKPYSCHICKRPFSDSSSLARHRRIHLREHGITNTPVDASSCSSQVATNVAD